MHEAYCCSSLENKTARTTSFHLLWHDPFGAKLMLLSSPSGMEWKLGLARNNGIVAIGIGCMLLAAAAVAA